MRHKDSWPLHWVGASERDVGAVRHLAKGACHLSLRLSRPCSSMDGRDNRRMKLPDNGWFDSTNLSTPALPPALEVRTGEGGDVEFVRQRSRPSPPALGHGRGKAMRQGKLRHFVRHTAKALHDGFGSSSSPLPARAPAGRHRPSIFVGLAGKQEGRRDAPSGIGE